MASHVVYVSIVTALFLVIPLLVFRLLRSAQALPVGKKTEYLDLSDISEEISGLSKTIASSLPGSTILRRNVPPFVEAINSYWAQQECENIPECVVRPRNVEELCVVLTLLRKEYVTKKNKSYKTATQGIFAVRSGGHSPVSGAASIEGGVLIDLCNFCEVTPSKDSSSVVIGAGAKWKDVSQILDKKGLAVVGGRNAAVGVGGLTLGGGLSFFSPRFGLVCSNVISYEVVVASGSVITASATENPDLWRALKGGANNFGIVTNFTVRSFPSAKIWSGFLYLPSFQATKVLDAFHEFVGRADPSNSLVKYDEYAAGPIACFSWIQQIRIQLISLNLVHTTPPVEEGKWPTYWRTSYFRSLWRFWSTCKLRTLSNATDELNSLNPPGRREKFATITIKNNPATLAGMHAAYSDGIKLLEGAKVKGLVWTLVLQPLLPQWARKGDPNPLGLDKCADEPLVIVSFTINWDNCMDDDLMENTTRRTIEQMESISAQHGTNHPYRYLNYCASWQKPFESYGEENLRFLRETSRKYDPHALFQKGCIGGFKLDTTSPNP